jgi:hypothetical protein
MTGFCFFRWYDYVPYGAGKISLCTSLWYKAFFAEQYFLFHFILYLSPIVIGYLVSSIIHKKWDNWLKPKFYILLTIGVSLFAYRASVHLYLKQWMKANITHEHLDWLISIASTVSRGGFLFIGIFLLWLVFDRKNQPFYGFTLKNFNTKPYFIMLAIMVPLIVAASTQADFLKSYPRVQKLSSLDISNSAHWVYFGTYEALYGLDFFGIEFFFRGFLILAFVHIVGPRAILPMAYIYLVIHWNKPMGELISSFFGGSLLGIVSYYSRSIVGGIIVHVGIAWMMEIGAFVSKYISP